MSVEGIQLFAARHLSEANGAVIGGGGEGLLSGDVDTGKAILRDYKRVEVQVQAR